MKFIPTELADVWLISPKRFSDDRGYFSETFKHNLFEQAIGRSVSFVQDNFSHSLYTGTVRGLHFQKPPFAQGKLIKCLRGRIQDVAIDIRKNSPSYGRSVSAELSEENGNQLWIPEGFLHGFCTLQENCDVAYKCTNYYSSECDANIRWDDADLNVEWKVDSNNVILSKKDKTAPGFADFDSPF
ncbi:dTDP-4-dehydrorhamnose 3,5-epimerase [Robiginitomaculum antarcticum]|uniref:dTDP-4-dehydrorhamnose 3,5-epimerase n=1 Tax=Robiginitomaculum antarcticum TaxID=437507 RepID=UPI00036741DB|nr:dTDP-4-dehydrorhamnose 3,5-epimerase [Robiginitomaculum antarcticum]